MNTLMDQMNNSKTQDANNETKKKLIDKKSSLGRVKITNTNFPKYMLNICTRNKNNGGK